MTTTTPVVKHICEAGKRLHRWVHVPLQRTFVLLTDHKNMAHHATTLIVGAEKVLDDVGLNGKRLLADEAEWMTPETYEDCAHALDLGLAVEYCGAFGWNPRFGWVPTDRTAEQFRAGDVVPDVSHYRVVLDDDYIDYFIDYDI